MSFLDKAKEKAKDLATQAKEKVDDLKETRKVDDLLTELGRITYRQHTGRGNGADITETEGLVSRLRDMEQAGAEVIAPPAAPETASSGTATTGTASGATASTGTMSSEPAEHPSWEPPTTTPAMPMTDPDEASSPLP